jgi:hypothetical protein
MIILGIDFLICIYESNMHNFLNAYEIFIVSFFI